MAQAIDWHGTNKTLRAHPTQENVNDLRVFSNGVCLVSCWELSDEELAEIVRTKQVFLSVVGPTSYPVFVGSETEVRNMNSDYGVWKQRG